MTGSPLIATIITLLTPIIPTLFLILYCFMMKMICYYALRWGQESQSSCAIISFL